MFRGNITVNDKDIGSWRAVRLDAPADEQGRRQYGYWVNVSEHVGTDQIHLHGTITHNPREGSLVLFFKILQAARIEKATHDLIEVVNPQ